ncbi:MAG TPA: hypothetical protein DCF96_14340 [Rhodobacteraceae bacterium]|nr:hypothetical protein [Paracoccaceae bacterium]|tara:strand:+ start:13938 stop:14360 length:423 start_codon:yes stop_codon:yes gene_type:complete
MAITQAMCTSFKEDLFQKEQDMDSDTIKIALYTSSASLDAATTSYTTSGEVASGGGYTTGGETLTSPVIGTSGTTAYVDFDNPEWTSASFTTAGALIYNDTTAGNNSIAVLNFGGDFTVTSGTFRIVFPSPGAAGLIRID